DAAFRRAGVLRVQNISDLFYMSEVLAKQPRPRGNRLTIITNAGGPGVLATDALIQQGGVLAPVSAETVEKLNAFLPAAWSHANPIDVLGDAPPERYAKTLELAAKDENSDGLLVILTPQDMTEPTLIAEALAKHAKIPGKPVIASWMGGPMVEAGESILNRAGIPTFPFPDTAAKAFCYMYRYAYNLKGIYETPTLPTPGLAASAASDSTDGATHGASSVGFRHATGAAEVLRAALSDNRTLLDEIESKRLLAAYGIPTTRTELATTPDAAAALADSMTYPVVLKLYSRTLTHKTDVGGVKLSLKSREEVVAAFDDIRASVTRAAGAEHFLGVTVQPMVKLKDAYEIILGASPDPQFGPVLLFGTGGQLVEVFKDRALGLPPLNATLARRMMEQTRIYHALHGVRGRAPVDLVALEHLLVRFSQLVAEQRRIREIDINPLLVSPDGQIALDARVVLYGPDVPDDQLPHLAIRPYPVQYVGQCVLKTGQCVDVRPIRPEDEPLIARFHQNLSERSVRLRYFATLKLSQRVSHERLLRVCFNDYDREMALVAVTRDPQTRQEDIVAVARLTRLPGGPDAEFALLVSDPWQGKGLGKHLLSTLLRVARDEQIRKVAADILPENVEMQRLCSQLGFTLARNLEEGTVKAWIGV
ncbi:MAG TPA: GNAT family N-acetyltransferase, partial [Tepidisphaeraceae bacterium]|nr:GNAT family N-acetyltransferase [Tepidisphaeraceae bacterium]